MPIRQTATFLRGLLYLFRGLRLIFSSGRLFKLSLLPFLVNTAVFVVFLLSFSTIAWTIADYVFQESSQEWYWATLSVVLGVVMFAVSILAALFGFVAVGLIVAGPFNDLLSAAVEEEITGKVEEEEMGFFGQAGLILRTETKKMAIFLVIEGVLLLLNFIPGLGQLLFVVLNPLFIAFVMMYEFTGYTLDRRGFGFTAKRRYVFSRAGLAMGFGGAVGVTLLVPLVHFLLMPVAVAGGTALVIDNPPDAFSHETGSDKIVAEDHKPQGG